MIDAEAPSDVGNGFAQGNDRKQGLEKESVLPHLGPSFKGYSSLQTNSSYPERYAHHMAFPHIWSSPALAVRAVTKALVGPSGIQIQSSASSRP